MESPSNVANENTRQKEADILKKYYSEHDFFLSTEGILKIVSVILCIVSSLLFLVGHWCAGAPLLVRGSAAVALACAAVTSLLYAGGLLTLPLRAPHTWLFADIILSTIMGVLLLITAILNMTLCELQNAIDYFSGPIAIINSIVVTSSTLKTYLTVTRLWDNARTPTESNEGPPAEVDV